MSEGAGFVGREEVGLRVGDAVVGLRVGALLVGGVGAGLNGADVIF